jgi:3D (Asp-Asp-Asp) domain-containing protein
VAVEETPRPAPVVVAKDEPPRGEKLGDFRFTMYYVAVEGDGRRKRGGDAMLASGTPDNLSGRPDRRVLYHAKGCKPIAEVSRNFGRHLDVQGTGKLRDGRVLNTTGVCDCPISPCYREIKAVWAMGANGRLSPFRSVAVDRKIKLGTLLYVPELDGARMPGKAPWGGFVHDGCVVADDRGGGIGTRELDLFVAKKSFSDALYRRHRWKRVGVYDGKGWCERRDGKVRKRDGAS